MLSSVTPLRVFTALSLVALVIFGALLSRMYYLPRLAKEQARVVDLRVAIESQNADIERLQAAGRNAREAGRKALAQAQAQSAEAARTVEQLRADIAARKYRDESCEAAAAWLGDAWRAR